EGANSGYVGISAGYYNGANVQANPINVMWFYMRAYPPNGVMPGYTVNTTPISVYVSASSNPIAYGSQVVVTAHCPYATDDCALDYSNNTQIASGAGSASYTFNAFSLAAGTYGFYANDITNSTLSSPFQLTVSKNSTYEFSLLVPSNYSYENESAKVTATISTRNSVIKGSLYFNGTLINSTYSGSLNYVTRSHAGDYAFTFNTPGNANYSAESINRTLAILKALPTLKWIKTCATPIYDGAQLTCTVNASISTINNQVNASLYFSNTLINSTNSIITYASGSGSATAAGSTVFTFNTLGNENYSIASINTTFTIDKAIPTLSWIKECSNYVYSGSACTVNASISTINNQVNASLYIGGTLLGKTNKYITGNSPSAASTYTFTFSTTGNSNYTSNSISNQFTISKATPVDYLYVNSSGVNAIVTTVSNQLAANLYLNGNLIANDIYTEYTTNIPSTTGLYVYAFNSTGNNNYTSFSITKKYLFSTAPTLPSGILYYVPIGLDNNQSVATPAPFQQSVNITESSYSGNIVYNDNFANFEYFYANGTVIPAWIEENSSGKILTWLNIANGIPAHSNIVVYLGFASTSTNLLSSSGTTGIGEAPQLSSTYGEYDDGASVFNHYWNFAGATLPSGFTENVLSNPAGATGNYAVNNGITITNTDGQDFWDSDYMITLVYYSTPVTTIGQIWQTRIDSLTGNSGDGGWTKAGIVIQNNITDSSVSNGEAAIEATSGQGFAYQWQSGTSYVAPSGSYHAYGGYSISYPAIESLIPESTSTVGGYYGRTLGSLSQEGYSSTPTSMSSTGSVGLLITAHYDAGTSSATFQYLLSRAYPPSGVMPVPLFGSLS
ncbi:hypothetical protein M1373_02040, partial [Candidatus Marsarchaeota archaeon]|nr:hypothetical protein [Candidatus Marsarchaeota archaeon]MCL5404315.1 hypothetical protein [Candidatus Marsarchaeota archaeon]